MERREGGGDRVKAKQYWGAGIFLEYCQNKLGEEDLLEGKKSTSAWDSINTFLSPSACAAERKQAHLGEGEREEVGGYPPRKCIVRPRSELILIDCAPGKRKLLSCPFSREVAPGPSWSFSFPCLGSPLRGSEPSSLRGTPSDPGSRHKSSNLQD